MTIIRYLWALPCTLVGALIALACVPTGLPRWHEGTIELRVHHCIPPFAIAQTWGWLILYRGVYRDTTRMHERVHVEQYLDLGPLFFIAYPLASLLAVMRGEDGYRDNYFERQAYDHVDHVLDGEQF